MGSVAGTLALAVLPGQALAATATEIVITGSRIPQANLVTTSPVTQIGSADIGVQGVTKIDDLTNQLPNVFAGQNATIANGASGTATVDLRGLGSARTLVLMDGKRMPYGNPFSSAADLNQIPAQLVERVEVLTGGASAIYGSDAIAGVVNFIMKKDYEGLQVDGQFNFYQHHNDYDGPGYLREVIAARALATPQFFKLPKRDVTDGYGRDISAILGTSTGDNRGHIQAYFSWHNEDAVLQANRDYSECALGAPSAAAVAGVPAGALHWTCGGSSTTEPLRILSLASGFNNTIDTAGGGNLWRAYNGATDAYNFAPVNHYQRPSERYSFGAFGTYDITPGVELYTQLMFTDYSTFSQIAASGFFFGNPATISCDENPLLNNNQLFGFRRICAAAPGSAEQAPVYIGRRNVEGGGRQNDLQYESYRAVAGFRGQAWEGWDYDLSASYAKVTLANVYRNDFSLTRIAKALDVVGTGPDGVLGNADDAPICRSVLNGTDPNCVPYNIYTVAGSFGGRLAGPDGLMGTADDILNTIPGGVTQAALDYLQVPLLQRAFTEHRVVTGALTGDLGPWGIKSPWADESFKAAAGFEVRRDSVKNVTDENFSTGNGAGQGGPTLGLDGATDLWELFGEVRMPMVENVWLAKLISMDAAYRYSDYDNGVHAHTYKFGADWAPTEDVRFRASFQHAIRAANVVELFSPQGLGLFDLPVDPCDTANGGAITTSGAGGSATCRWNGVGVQSPWQLTAAQATSGLVSSPAGQYNFLGGGNPNLDPERANTYTVGVVFTPTMVPGLIATVDWWSVKVSNAISAVSPGQILNGCYIYGLLSQCSRITRNPGLGALWVNNSQVESLNTNIGGITTKGVDISALYSFDFADMGWANVGSLSVSMFGTWLDTLLADPGVGTPNVECAGHFFGNPACGSPNPEWRHRFRLTWDTPWHFDISGTWRYYGAVDQNGKTLPLNTFDGSWDAMNYFDLSGHLNLTKRATLRAGVNNILDTDPPIGIVGAGTNGNGNTYPQTYDALGRYIFMGITIDM